MWIYNLLAKLQFKIIQPTLNILFQMHKTENQETKYVAIFN